MPREQRYDRILGNGRARLRVEIYTDGKIVTGFVVQLEARHEGHWKPVRRSDDAHGQPHLDMLDRRGRLREKRWLSYTRNEALTIAIDDIRTNWETYVAEFMEW